MSYLVVIRTMVLTITMTLAMVLAMTLAMVLAMTWGLDAVGRISTRLFLPSWQGVWEGGLWGIRSSSWAVHYSLQTL
jgi:hypothetical protein